MPPHPDAEHRKLKIFRALGLEHRYGNVNSGVLYLTQSFTSGIQQSCCVSGSSVKGNPQAKFALPCVLNEELCINTSLQSIGKKKWSEGGRPFIHRTVILHHIYRLCCCTLILLLENAHGVKGLKNMMHLFQKRIAM